MDEKQIKDYLQATGRISKAAHDANMSIARMMAESARFVMDNHVFKLITQREDNEVSRDG